MTISSINNKAANLVFLKKKKFNVPKLDVFKRTNFLKDSEKKEWISKI